MKYASKRTRPDVGLDTNSLARIYGELPPSLNRFNSNRNDITRDIAARNRYAATSSESVQAESASTGGSLVRYVPPVLSEGVKAEIMKKLKFYKNKMIRYGPQKSLYRNRHTYIHNWPLQFFTPLMLCALILYVSDQTYSLTSTPIDRLLRNFLMAGLFTLRVFARNLLRGSRRRNIFHISY